MGNHSCKQGGFGSSHPLLATSRVSHDDPPAMTEQRRKANSPSQQRVVILLLLFPIIASVLLTWRARPDTSDDYEYRFATTKLRGSDQGGSLQGTVTDAKSEKPIPGIEVWLFSPSGHIIHELVAHTDEQGQYSVPHINTDDYSIGFRQPGHLLQDGVPFSIAAGQQQRSDMALVPSIPTIVTVQDATNQSVIAGASLLITASIRRVPPSMFDWTPRNHRIPLSEFNVDYLAVENETDTDGQASLFVPPGQYDIIASAPGYATQTWTQVVGNTAKPVEVSLSRGGKIRGRVLDPSGHPLAAHVVIARKDRSMVTRYREATRNRVETSADGRFELTAVPNAEFHIFAITAQGATGFHHERGRLIPVTVKGPEAIHVDLTVPPLTVVQGQLKTETGDPIAGATLEIQCLDFLPSGADSLNDSLTSDEWKLLCASTRSDDEGRFHFAGLRVSWQALSLEISGEGIPMRKEWVPTEDGSPIELDIELPSLSAKITGLVSHEDGRPVRQARVWTAHGPQWGQSILSAETDASGRYTLEVPKGAQYDVSISASKDASWIAKRHERKGVRPGGTADFVVESARVLQGTVVTEAGEPIPEFTVIILGGSYPRLHTLHANKGQGRFTVRLRDRAGIRLQIVSPRFRSRTLNCGDLDDDTRITLKPTPSLRGRLLTVSGEPVAAADLFAATRGILLTLSQTSLRSGQTMADGSFEILNAPEKANHVIVSFEQDGALSLARVDLPRGRNEGIKLHLPALHDVEVSVKDKQGNFATGHVGLDDNSGPLLYRALPEGVCRNFRLDLTGAPLRLRLERGSYRLYHAASRGAQELEEFTFRVDASGVKPSFTVR